MKLTDAQIRRMKPGDRALSEDGLYVFVTKAGATVFRQNYRRPGSCKQNTLAHGIYPDVSLARARELRDAAKRMLALGQDPATVKRLEREQVRAKSETSATSFEAVAKRWLATPETRGGPRASQLERSTHAIRRRLVPAFGKTPITDVTPKQVADVVQPIAESGKNETARRTKLAASKVFQFAARLGLCTANPTTMVHVEAGEREHHPHLKTEREIGAFARSVRAYQGLLVVTRYALELLLLTFVRPGELCNAPWAEFELDVDEPTWRIEPARMKGRAAHVVPLSRQAVALLRELRTHSPGALLFPGLRARTKPMTTAALLSALARMGYGSEQLTPHGLRGTASTWLNEHGERFDAVEAQLAHVERNAVRAAYNHAKYMPERRAMMQRWADAIDRMRDTSTEAT